MPKPLVVIGDVHGGFTTPGPKSGRPSLYHQLPKIEANTVVLGDYGVFNGQDVRTLRKIKPRSNYWDRGFRGNHDNPELFNSLSWSLGDFGVLPEYPDIMFFAGAESTDVAPDPLGGWAGRIEGKTWWPDEQLSEEQMERAYDLYEQVKPRVVLSHECPSSCYGLLSFGPGFVPWKWAQNRTARFLDNLLHIHRPAWWGFGHHHQSRGFHLDGTYFRCVDELEVVPVVGGYADQQEGV